MKHKKTVKEVNNATSDWKIVHLKKRIKTLSNIAVTNTKDKKNT